MQTYMNKNKMEHKTIKNKRRTKNNLEAGEVGTLGGNSKLRRTAAMPTEQEARGVFSPRQVE